MSFLVDLIVSLLIVVGALFLLVGSLGLIKLPDLMSRLHGPTKATTLGVGGALIASMIFFGAESDFSIHEVLITVFLFLTAPITANFVAKAYLHQHRDEVGELPDTGRGCGWATFDQAPADERVSETGATGESNGG